MNMKKILIILTLFLSLTLFACGETTTEEINALEPYEIKTNTTEYGDKSYIEDINNVPIISLSTEVRLDLLILADHVTYTELESYFKLASETGFNTLELAFMWSSIETEYDVYDDTLINQILDLANTYQLMINLNWYGSFVDGETRSSYIPSYIYDDRETYPYLADLYDFGVLGRVGIIDFDNEDLILREQLAIKELMNYVNLWSTQNQAYPLVQVQIGQGLDRFPRWRISQYEIKDTDGILMTSQRGWELVNNYIDHISMAVKQSNYKAITRVEFTEQNAVVNYVYDIYDLEYVDLVCPTYLHQMPSVKSGMLSFQDAFDSMPIYNAQNWGDDSSYRLMLASFALGGIGFTSYPLSFPRFYPVSNTGVLFSRLDLDSETPFIEVNQRATNLNAVMLGLEKAYIDVAKTPRRNFLVLGMDNRIEADQTQKLYTYDGVFVDADIDSDGVGFIISNDGYVFVYSTEPGTITFDHVTFLNATYGYYDELGDWVSLGDQALTNSNLTIEILENTLYRLKIYSVEDLPNPIPSDYNNSYDAIRQ